VYPHGSVEYYRDCYEPTWGRHRARTRPTAGNHDYTGDGGNAYYSYFGVNAGPAGLGYYSYNLGAWHIIALNSNLHMNRGSAQYEWLRADLAANSGAACTAAIWHHPLHTSGENGRNTYTYDTWRLLYEARADVILNGHDHIYERFAPQDPDGRPAARGIRQFTIGTGGSSLYRMTSLASASEVREAGTWGVLKLTLRAASYEWEFLPVAGQSFRDFGRADCVP
jgi:hypothetical protein